MIQVGDQVRINLPSTPLHGRVGTITEYSIDDYYHVLVNGTSFNGWYLRTELEPYPPITEKGKKDE